MKDGETRRRLKADEAGRMLDLLRKAGDTRQYVVLPDNGRVADGRGDEKSGGDDAE